MSVLSAETVSLAFGGVQALVDVSVEARAGEIVGVIGPNGAGKTTLLNVISGMQRPDRGTVCLGDVPITGLRPSAIAALGVGRASHSSQPLASMSLIAN